MEDMLDQVRQDITPFLDPGTVLEEVSSGRHSTLSWISRGSAQEAHFSLNDEGSFSVFVEGQTMTYKAFLSKISDILNLARTIFQIRGPEFYIPTQAKINAEQETDATDEMPAIELLRARIDPSQDDATRVVFVTGDAGAGKTEVMKQLVRRQAELYVKGEATFLYLYVNAQGRALARLDEALATEIQDLRATKITYHVVPTLTRNGIMVPIIDGFDELLGVLGYEDAFSSLRRFLDELNGKGTLIASARSTYYQQEFISRSGRGFATNQRVEVEQIDILPWGAAQFEEFIGMKYRYTPSPRLSIEAFRADMRQAFSSTESRDLKAKPFFISKIANLILSGSPIDKENIVERLVEGYVERERSEKLLDKNRSPLLSAEQIVSYIQMVAEEMWITETRALYSESLRLLAELAFPVTVVAGDSANIIRERAPTMAFFSPASGRDRIEFEHEIFFSYFLGDTICRDFRQGESALHRCLSRAQLPESASRFASEKISSTEASTSHVLEVFSSVGERFSSRPNQVRENCGALVAAHLRRNATPGQYFSGLVIRSLTFAGGQWSGVLIQDSTLSDVVFSRGDFTQAKFVRCSAHNVQLQDVILDIETSVLDITGIDPDFDIYGLRTRNQNRVEQVFRHQAIRNILQSCGMSISRPEKRPSISTDASDLLEKMMRKFERSTLFWPNDTDNSQVTHNPLWETLEATLLRANIVARESVAHKGTPRPALKRNYLPIQIMEGEDGRPVSSEDITRFWQEMRASFPSSDPDADTFMS